MFERSCQIHSFQFSLSTHCKHVEAGLASLFPAFEKTNTRCRKNWAIERSGITITTSPYVTCEDGRIIHETELIGDALDCLEWRITAVILQNLAHFVQLHAAGLVSAEKALLLSGPPGSGKTSLALSMLRRGWKCLSDEIMLIDPVSETIWPFPRNFHINRKSMWMFPDMPLKENAQADCDSGRKIRFDPGEVISDWVSGPSRPEWIVFPKYEAGCSGELLPLGETEALSLLLPQAINSADHGKRGLDFLLSLIHDFRCYRLITGDLNTATCLLEDLTGRKQEPPFLKQPGQTALH